MGDTAESTSTSTSTSNLPALKLKLKVRKILDTTLWDRADHSQIVKVYDKLEGGRKRYSPGHFVTVEKTATRGVPNLDRVSTSFVERQNGTLGQWRMRLTRLTYAFSKEVGELRGGAGPLFCLLQFLHDSWVAAGHSSNGIGIDRSRLGHRRPRLHAMTHYPILSRLSL